MNTYESNINGGLNAEQLLQAESLRDSVRVLQDRASYSAGRLEDVCSDLESESMLIVLRGLGRASVQSGTRFIARYQLIKADLASKKHYLSNQGEYYTTAKALAEYEGKEINILSSLN